MVENTVDKKGRAVSVHSDGPYRKYPYRYVKRQQAGPPGVPDGPAARCRDYEGNPNSPAWIERTRPRQDS